MKRHLLKSDKGNPSLKKKNKETDQQRPDSEDIVLKKSFEYYNS